MKVYRFLNLLSIDVAAGAIVCALFFASIMQVKLRAYGIASLGLSVWIIYTLDHLLDVRAMSTTATTDRHRLHQKYFKFFVAALIIAGIADLIVILNIRMALLFWGIALSVFVLLYLLIQRWLTPLKEFFGSLLYSGGILIPALSFYEKVISVPVLMLIVSFVLTAWINLILFSIFDLDNDLSQTQSSIVTFLGRSTSSNILRAVMLVQLLLISGIFCFSSFKLESTVLFSMNLVLIMLFFFQSRFQQRDRFRILGDIIFLFPVPYLILHAI